jgi:hypothetical protein
MFEVRPHAAADPTDRRVSLRSRRSIPRSPWGPLWIATVLVLAGCASFQPQPPPDKDPGGNYVTLTTPFIAIGDTQEHESTGFPLHDNDSAVDAYVEVAQRPPEQPLFGRRIMEWVIERHPDEPLIHLGDVLDLSCRSEADRMVKLYRAATQPMTVLPGNHDGMMFGIYNYGGLEGTFDTNVEKWNRVCKRGAAQDDPRNKTAHESLNKRESISIFLSAWHGYGRPGSVAPQPSGEQRISWRDPDPTKFVSGLEVQLRGGRDYALSFLAQRLRLPPAQGAQREVIIIALDTNQLGPLASMWDTVMGRSPGSLGHVHADQIRAVTPWVIEAARNGDIVVFAGHHNWSALAVESRLLMRQLISNVPHPLVYLSAHTHRGFWAAHRTLDRRPLLELNVSSLTDWPIAYRRISFAYDEANQRLKVRGELMPNAGRSIESDADLLQAWETQTCDRSGKSPGYLKLLDAALVTQQRQARGSLLDWMVASLAPVCESCEALLYDHAQRYHDLMLDALIQLDTDLATRASKLHELKMPAWCKRADFGGCAQQLKDDQATDFKAHVELFRRKAQLVDLVSDHLDDLTNPEAKAYMTCRAVMAARADFEATPDDANSNRGEAKRRAENFFMIEGSVGMD